MEQQAFAICFCFVFLISCSQEIDDAKCLLNLLCGNVEIEFWFTFDFTPPVARKRLNNVRIVLFFGGAGDFLTCLYLNLKVLVQIYLSYLN